MAVNPFRSYRRGLEPAGEILQVGVWRIAPLLDPVRERRFLHFSLRSKALPELVPSLLSFRAQAAKVMSTATCAEVLSISTDTHHVEFLTDYYEIVTPEAPGDDELRELFEMVLQTLAHFERYRFHASDLFPESFGKDGDGNFVLLPNAYVLPCLSDEGRPSPSSSLRLDLKTASQLKTLDPHIDFESEIVHTSLVERLIGQFGLDRSDGSDFCATLLRVAEAISRGEIRTLFDVYARIFGRPLTPRFRPDDASGDDRHITSCVDRVVQHATVDRSVILVRGRSYTGKTSILKRAAAVLDRSEAFSVVALDEWDLHARSPKRPRRKSRAAQLVWMIDDIDEKAFAHTPFSEAILQPTGGPKGSIIISVSSTGISDELKTWLEELPRQRGDRYHEVVTDIGEPNESSGLARYINAALDQLGVKTRRGATIESLASVFLKGLGEEERQLLELIAVTRFAVPLDVILSAFSESGDTIREAILYLAALGTLELFYRPVARKKAISLFVRMESAAFRRLIYQTIPEERRRKLHRTVTLMAEHHESFPDYFLIAHGLESGDGELAVRHAVAYLRETDPEDRHPHIVGMCARLLDHNLIDGQPFSDQVTALHEISQHFLRNGQTQEAERYLLACRDRFESAGADQKPKNASRLSAACRSLAELWDARGEFKRALALLNLVKEELQSALPLPEQAQLLNDLSWIQYRLGNYDKSIDFCRLTLNTLNASDYPIIVAQALNQMGVLHFNTSRYDEAISYYEQSALLRDRAGDEIALAASYNNLGLAYQSKGDYEKAFAHLNRSVELKLRGNSQAVIAGGYLNLALLHLELGDLKRAEEKCRQSLAIGETIRNPQLIADNYITLGDIAREGGDPNTAEREYHKSLDISQKQEAINEEMGALRRLSSLCLKQGRFDEATKYVTSAFELVQRIGSKLETAQIEAIFGDLELAQNRPIEALSRYKRASNQYIVLSKYGEAATILSRIGHIHAQAGNTIEARHQLDRAQELIRADIGSEIPEDFVKLQQMLRARPAAPPVGGEQSQKLLMAFYDLSALTDYALDGHEFLQRMMDVVKEITNPIDCYLAFKWSDGEFETLDGTGDNVSLPKATRAVLEQTLLLGGLLDSESPDITDLSRKMALPEESKFVCLPLKAMGEEIGCLLLYLDASRLPLSKEDVDFYTGMCRQIASGLKLMLHLNPGFLKPSVTTPQKTSSSNRSREGHFQNLIGESDAMRRIFAMLEKVKHTDSGILILGESGTGKSALAGAIHYESPRHHQPFQEIHCAQIPHNLLESELFGHERGAFTGAVQRKLGLCEMAAGGTVFLDDINVMPVETQTKLLHFLEKKTFIRLGGTQQLSADVRIIAASNEDLETLCELGRFRQDLYYRLKVILVDLPPLRERNEDMLAIAVDYLKRSCTQKGIPTKTLSPETIQLFQSAPWRGNVRELQNVLERVVILSEDTEITPETLPEDVIKEAVGVNHPPHQRLDELADQIVRLDSYSESRPLLPILEAILAKRMVEHVEGKGRAASLLGISKPTLYARLRDYDKIP